MKMLKLCFMYVCLYTVKVLSIHHACKFHCSQCVCLTGAINRLDVLITTGGDIFFEIQHPSDILVPVQLYILYIDATDPSRTVPQVSTTVYQSTSLITHFVPSSLIPSGFTRVRMMIALQHQDLQGPIYTSGLDYGRFYFKFIFRYNNIIFYM